MEKVMSLWGRIFISLSKACSFWSSRNHTHLTLDIWMMTVAHLNLQYSQWRQKISLEDSWEYPTFIQKLSVHIFFVKRSIFHLDKIKFIEKGILKMYVISSVQCTLLVQMNNYGHVFPHHIFYKTSQRLCSFSVQNNWARRREGPVRGASGPLALYWGYFSLCRTRK